MNKHGFSLIEIIISLAILATIFSFIFYFLSSINYKNKIINKAPYMLTDYNYSDKYCYVENDQINNLSLMQSIELNQYISTSTPVTSLHIFNKNKLIITTNSASTTESDIFVFVFSVKDNFLDINLIQKLDVGPGINDAVLHNDMLYVLNTSVNSHVKSFKLDINGFLIFKNDIKIDELTVSYAMPKKIYIIDKNLFIGTEKNNNGGELFLLPLDHENLLQYPTKSQEIGGQVSGIYMNQDKLYIANASDIELFVYDKDLNHLYEYDAPLSLGNGKAVYSLEPYVYLGRTVASFELFLLEIKENILNYIDKYKVNGSIDFLQQVNENLLVITSAPTKELQFYNQDMNMFKSIDLPSRVSSYNCFKNTFIFSIMINNQSQILWLK